jgi:hypothetical protein
MSQVIDLGRIRFYHRGAYNAGTTYELNDVVTYGGASYVYIYAATASGNLPTNATYWSKLADGLDQRGAWTTATAYYPGDVVTRGGSNYVALLAHTSGTFATDLSAAKWEELTRGFRWRSNWATSTSYLKDDVVFVNGNAYVATADFTSDSSAFANDTNWQLFSEGGTGEIPSQSGHDGKFLTTDGTSVSWANVANSFTLAADSGSNDTFSIGQTLTISGTANEITTAVSNNAITISQPDNVTVAANLTVSGSTAATSTGSGAFVLTGGAGIGGNTYIGGNLHVSGTTNLGDATISNLTVSGTTTTINTATLTVNDNIVILNNDVTGSPTENAGIEIERGTSDNVLLRWNETNDQWEWTDDGSAYTPFANAIVKTTLTAKGDLYVAIANATVTRLAVGTNGQALKANSSTASGLEWGQAGYQPDDAQMVVAGRVFG